MTAFSTVFLETSKLHLATREKITLTQNSWFFSLFCFPQLRSLITSVLSIWFWYNLHQKWYFFWGQFGRNTFDSKKHIGYPILGIFSVQRRLEYYAFDFSAVSISFCVRILDRLEIPHWNRGRISNQKVVKHECWSKFEFVSHSTYFIFFLLFPPWFWIILRIIFQHPSSS